MKIGQPPKRLALCHAFYTGRLDRFRPLRVLLDRPRLGTASQDAAPRFHRLQPGYSEVPGQMMEHEMARCPNAIPRIIGNGNYSHVSDCR